MNERKSRKYSILLVWEREREIVREKEHNHTFILR